MYIRSQSRKFLGKVLKVEISGMDDDQIWCEEGCLGVYKDKQRCLEVMNEIQSHIEGATEIYSEATEYETHKGISIFEMPLK